MPALKPLAVREQIWKRHCEGATNCAISLELGIDRGTVADHIEKYVKAADDKRHAKQREREARNAAKRKAKTPAPMVAAPHWSADGDTDAQCLPASKPGVADGDKDALPDRVDRGERGAHIERGHIEDLSIMLALFQRRLRLEELYEHETTALRNVADYIARATATLFDETRPAESARPQAPRAPRVPADRPRPVRSAVDAADAHEVETISAQPAAEEELAVPQPPKKVAREPSKKAARRNLYPQLDPSWA